MSTRPGIAPESPDPHSYNITTAAGYTMWRRDGGKWNDETAEPGAHADEQATEEHEEAA